MKLYEIVLVVRPELSGDQAQAVVHGLGSVLAARGGTLAAFEYSGLRPLAYPVRKYARAHYLLMSVEAPAEAVQEVCRLLRLNEDVLRFLNTCVEKHATLPSPLVWQRNERDQDFDTMEKAEHRPVPGSATPSTESVALGD